MLWKIERVAFRFNHPIGSNFLGKCGKLSQFTHVRKKRRNGFFEEGWNER